MRITAEMRAAVRAVCSMQKRKSRDYDSERRLEQKAIEDFFAKFPETARTLTEIKARREKLNDESYQLGQDILKFGLSVDLSTICNDEDFKQAGGVLIDPDAGRLSEVQIIAELAAAPAKDAKTILAKYNINWE